MPADSSPQDEVEIPLDDSGEDRVKVPVCQVTRTKSFSKKHKLPNSTAILIFMLLLFAGLICLAIFGFYSLVFY